VQLIHWLWELGTELKAVTVPSWHSSRAEAKRCGANPQGHRERQAQAWLLQSSGHRWAAKSAFFANISTDLHYRLPQPKSSALACLFVQLFSVGAIPDDWKKCNYCTYILEGAYWHRIQLPTNIFNMCCQ